MKVGHRAPPGDDTVAVPPPLQGLPPAGQACDLVLTGGVASGVVYPWAVLEIARAFQLRQIGGTSVGAMAAALAAAAEYGRRQGYDKAFEALRRAPEQLAEVLPDGRTRMLSLFQPVAAGQRPFELFVAGVRAGYGNGGLRGVLAAVARRLLVLYAGPLARGAGFGALLGVALGQVVLWAGRHTAGSTWIAMTLLAAIGGLIGGAYALWRALSRDLQAGLVDPHFGLCAGASGEPAEARDHPGLTDWLHEGIQRSAGLTLADAPLTFGDIWRAPLEPGGTERGGDEPRQRAIDLQMVTTNVTHMRPYRLPLLDPSSRLYFRPCELKGYFPRDVLAALVQRAKLYVNVGRDEPQTPEENTLPGDVAPHLDRRIYQLPEAGLPIVVAARLSLSYPLLFSAVPLYAVDREEPDFELRTFARCHFSDGGLCSNFPVHLFDAALPSRPTFGLWLDERRPSYQNQAVWLPDFFGEGRGDSWNRFDGGGAAPWQRMAGFLMAAGLTAKDWGDRTALRMAQTRHRVARLNLRFEEGALNIAMPRQIILRMAQEYGVQAGRAFVDRYAARPDGQPHRDWDRQRWVRLRVLMPALQRLLERFTVSAQGSRWATPVAALIERARSEENLLKAQRPGKPLTDEEAAAWHRVVAAASDFERALADPALELPLTSAPEPRPELRIRPPI